MDISPNYNTVGLVMEAFPFAWTAPKIVFNASLVVGTLRTVVCADLSFEFKIHYSIYCNLNNA